MKNQSAEAKKLIDAPNFACVATLMPDGSPQISPVWIDRDNDTIIINSRETTQKVRNLRRDRRVAVCVYDLSNPHSRLLIRGLVLEITKKEAEEHIDKVEMKYNGNPKYPRHDVNHPRTIIRIQPVHITESIIGN